MSLHTRSAARAWPLPGGVGLGLVLVLLTGLFVMAAEPPVESDGPVAAPGSDATLAALATARERLQWAIAQVSEGKDLTPAREAVQEAIATLEGLTNLARLIERKHLLGQAYGLLGKLYLCEKQNRHALDALATAMNHLAVFANSEAASLANAISSGGGFKTLFEDITFVLRHQVIAHRALGDPEGALKAWKNLKGLAEKLERKELMVEAAENILALMEESPQLADVAKRRAEARAELGFALVNAGREERGFDSLAAAERELTKLPQDDDIAWTRAEVALVAGYACQGLGRHGQALPWLVRAEAGFAAIGSLKDRLRTLERIFITFYACDQFKKAESILRRQLELAGNATEHAIHAYYCRLQLSSVHLRLGDPAAGVKDLQDLQGVAARVEIPVALQVDAQVELGVMHGIMEQHAEALASYQRAVDLLADVSGSEARRAKYHQDMAIALQALRRPDQARARLEAGLALVADLPGAEVAAASLRKALAEDAEQRLGQVGAHLEACRRIVEELGDRTDAKLLVAKCLMSLGRAHQSAGNWALAESMFRGVLERVDAPVSKAITGSSFMVESMDHHDLGVAKIGVAFAALGQGNHAAAIAQLLEVARRGHEAHIAELVRMSTLERYHFMSRGKVRRATSAVAVAASFHGNGSGAEAVMAAVMADKSLFSNASRIQHAAMLNHRNTEPDRYRRYLQLRSQVATHVADWQRGPGQGPDSEVVERIFADIRDAEAILLRPLQDWIPDRTFDHALLPEVKAVLAPGQVLLEFVRFQPLDMQNVRQCIVPSEDDDANYGVFVLAPASPVVAINLGPCTAIDAALRRYQQTFNTQTLPLTFDPDEVRLAESARELHDLLFAPLHPVINNAKRVYIAPVGSLSQLAFESVPLRAVGGVPRYLIESSQVVYLDSGRDLLLHQARNGERPVQDIVLFGDPAFNDRAAGMTVTADGGGTRRPDPEAAEPAPATPLTTWPPLPKTRRLVEGIATTATTAGLHARLCLGADASQSNLLQVSRPGVLAFATHGAYFKTGPTIRFTIKSLSLGPKGNSIEGLSKNELLAADPLFRSALVLAGANRSDRATSLAHDDGLFTAYEAWGLDLRGTELVVLAGCETGLGVVQGQDDGGLRQPPGEVVAGMRQAFTVAGARSLIMSMWPVDVGMTSRQFDRFFHLWLSQKQERVAALRNAQLEALAEARARRGSGHPIWWAGFSYVGDPGDRPRQGK